MGFFDKVKKAFGSKKKGVESQNSVNEKVIDDSTFSESIENNNGNFNENEEIQSKDLEEIPANEEVIDKPTPTEKIRNFKYLDDLIHSSVKEIILDSDIILSDDEKLEYEEGIKLDVDDLIIDGCGHAIDANGKAKIFYCTGKNILIKNISLKNAVSKLYGGAIYNEGGKLTIEDSTLKENIARWDGGAINNNGELSIINSTFENNSSKNNGYIVYNEKNGIITISKSTFKNNNCGTIKNSGELSITKSILNENGSEVAFSTIRNEAGAEITIIDSTLNNNTADDGGAICNYNGDLIITGSTLNNNKATHGGAIDNIGELTITESTLTGNTAKDDGGAIQNKGKLTIKNSTLNKNTTLCSRQVSKGEGGAINNSGELSITKSILNENSAKFGGAINNKGILKIFNSEISRNNSPNNILENNDSLEMYNIVFNDNQSNDIIFNNDSKSILGIFYTNFSANTIEKSVITNSGRFCTIEKTNFKNNISNIHSKNIINNSELVLVNPEIKNKSKTILNNGHILVKKSSRDIISEIEGEGIIELDIDLIPTEKKFDFEYLDEKIHKNQDYEDEYIKITFEGKSKIIKLKSNVSLGKYESDFYEGGVELDMDNLIIDGGDNSIDGLGISRIFLITGKNILLKNIIFKNGHSYKKMHIDSTNNNGGAVKFIGDKLKLINCEFQNNLSEDKGGAIENNGDLSIINTTFDNNSASRGGAIENNGELSITESKFIKNRSNAGDACGGAIENNGELSVIESEFIKNETINEISSTATRGGAINNKKENNVIIIKSTFNENIGDLGGAIYTDKCNIKINESILNNNTAGSGGAIYHQGGIGSNIIINESILNENTASRDGGAIYNNGELIMTGSALSSNISGAGGAISNGTGGWLKIIESTFKNNIADLNDDWILNRGGAIWVFKSRLVIKESTFVNNNAKIRGGAIYLDDHKMYLSENCTFKDNAPDDVYENE